MYCFDFFDIQNSRRSNSFVLVMLRRGHLQAFGCGYKRHTDLNNSSSGGDSSSISNSSSGSGYMHSTDHN